MQKKLVRVELELEYDMDVTTEEIQEDIDKCLEYFQDDTVTMSCVYEPRVIESGCV